MNSSVAIFIKKHWDALLASVTVGVFLLLYTRHSGIGISPDSVTYLTVAENIRNHFSLVDFNQYPLVDFPVGYPFTLSLVMLVTGLSPLQFAPVLHIILFGGILFMTSFIISRQQNTSPLYKLLLLALLSFSPVLLEIYSMLWSETLFIFLSVTFFIAAYTYGKNHSSRNLIFFSIITGLCFLTRYAGISLVITGGAFILFDGDLGAIKKIKHLLVFGMIAVSGIVANLIHNHMVSGSTTGVREKALRTLGDTLLQVGNTVSDWLPFLHGYALITIILVLLVFMVSVYSIVFRILQQQFYHSFETIISLFFVVYLLFMITIASVSRFEDLSSRLLSPIYIPLLLVGSSWIPASLQKMVYRKKWLLLLPVLIIYSGFAYHQYSQNAEAWEGIKDAGIPGYTEDSWKESATIQYIRNNKNLLSPILYSDAYDAAYFLAGIHSLPLPHKEISEERSALLQNKGFSVIWLNDGFNPDLVDINFIKQHKKIIFEKQLADGAVYTFADSSFVLPK